VNLGVTFPQTEIGTDPLVIRDYAQAAEDLGYHHLLVYDHVIGAQPGEHRPNWRGPYTYQSTFHEPFVLFGYLGAVTTRLEFVTGILILPQRQTALAAKQAAAVDVLTGGRLRLGVAIGWNDVEYEVLNENFHNRGRRIEEQMEVMRLLWTQDVVVYKGRWHHLDHVAICPLPVQRPIPLIIGGMSEAAMTRAARIADGWYPQFRPGGADPQETLDRFFSYVREAGRDPQDLTIQSSSGMMGDPDEWGMRIEQLGKAGVTHISVNTMGLGLTNPREHIEAIRRYKEAVG
jgi:probable F420-dependent oxidoreductase